MNLYRIIQARENQKKAKCLAIRNKFDKYYYKCNNRTHNGIDDLKSFIEQAAKLNVEIAKDLSFIKNSCSIYWKV